MLSWRCKYHREDLVKFQHVDSMSDLCGLAVKAMASESKGRELELRLWQEEFFISLPLLAAGEAHANEINHDIHLANTLFSDINYR